MIQLTCSHCNTVLTIDDAFAGGVCRCQHCGTIQTVPTPSAAIRRPATPTEMPQSPAGPAPAPVVSVKSKTLVEGAAPAPADNLDALAQAVSGSGSGLSSSGIRAAIPQPAKPAPAAQAPAPASPPAEADPEQRRRMILIGLCVAGMVVLLAVGATIAYLAGKDKPAAPGGSASGQGAAAGQGGAGSSSSSSAGTPIAAVGTPNFMDLPLTAPTVVYILDRGQGTIDTYGPMCGATMLSLRSLGPGRKFQVIYWERSEEVTAVPEDLVAATDENIAKAADRMKDVFAFGQTSAAAAVAKAIEKNPGEIVIASGKFGLDDEFVDGVMAARKTSNVKIHAVCLGRGGSPEAMRKVAEKTGGLFKEVASRADLDQFGQHAPN